MKMITVVPDTNVLLKGFLSHQNDQRQLLNLALGGKIVLYGSQLTYEEFVEKIQMKRLERYLESKMYSPEKVISDYLTIIGMVTIDKAITSKTYCKDPDDDEFIRICESSDSKIIISEDERHLLSVNGINGIRIINTKKFLDSVRNCNSGLLF